MAVSVYVSHESALTYWRTNPPWYVLEGRDRDIRSLQDCAQTAKELRAANLPEAEFGTPPIDVLVPASRPLRCPAGFRLHKQHNQLPHHALFPLWDGVYVVSPELCFVQACQNLNFIGALELGMELCGTYALRSGYPEDMAQRDYTLMNASTLPRRLQGWQGLRGLLVARKAAKYLANGSASPMETKLYLMLCLPLQYGGYNLGHPELNPELELTTAEREILRVTKIKPDILWRKHKIVVEYDGRQHEEDKQSKYDALRTTVLENRGFTVLTIKRHQLYNSLALDDFASSIRSLLGVRKRTETPKHRQARDDLWSQLL